MPSAADLVLDNAYWRIASISPTATLTGRPVFHEIDPTDLSPDQSSGLTRGFSVAWLSQGEDADIDGAQVGGDAATRSATHAFEVSVYYDAKLGWRTAQRLALLDRHDIAAALRPDTSWSGYSDAEPDADIGLISRILESVELELDTYWTLRLTFRCAIDETE